MSIEFHPAPPGKIEEHGAILPSAVGEIVALFRLELMEHVERVFNFVSHSEESGFY